MTEASTGSVAHCAGSGWVPVIRTSTRWAGALRSGVPASLHRVVLFTPSRGIEVAQRLARLTVTASTTIGLSGRLAAVGADRDDGTLLEPVGRSAGSLGCRSALSSWSGGSRSAAGLASAVEVDVEQGAVEPGCDVRRAEGAGRKVVLGVEPVSYTHLRAHET